MLLNLFKLFLSCLLLGALSAAYDWNTYYSIADTNEFLLNLTEKNHDAKGYYIIGQTEHNHHLRVFEIVFLHPDMRNLSRKPSIFIDAGIYGNEWIAPAAATYIIHRLLTTKADDKSIRPVIEGFHWHIVPFLNPEGYEYSFTKDPLWRKNRKQYSSFCHGVDLNRNFDFHWNQDKSSRDPCSNVYAGPRANSEAETQLITDFMYRIPNLKLYISLQGYAEKLLYPYGFSNARPRNENKYKQVANAAVEVLKHRYGMNYTTGSMYNTMHEVSGNAMDWAASKGVELAFTYKLRPSVDYIHRVSRKVPRSQILPTVIETFDSLIAMLKKIKGVTS